MDLLSEAQEAAGGLDRWRTKDFLSARLLQGGGLWEQKGQAGVLDDVHLQLARHQEWVSHSPFGASDLRSSFTPRRVAIERLDGEVVETLNEPLASFAERGFDAPWSALQLAYFVGRRCGRISRSRLQRAFPDSRPKSSTRGKTATKRSDDFG
jgi:hypothetical protein